MKKAIFMFALALCFVGQASASKSYSYFRVGNASDVATATTAGTVLMGGGTDVDAAFQWMCQRSGNGDFLVIRATGTDAYNPYIQQLCPNEDTPEPDLVCFPDRCVNLGFLDLSLKPGTPDTDSHDPYGLIGRFLLCRCRNVKTRGGLKERWSVLDLND